MRARNKKKLWLIDVVQPKNSFIHRYTLYLMFSDDGDGVQYRDHEGEDGDAGDG